jgi:hypothetical protein
MAVAALELVRQKAEPVLWQRSNAAGRHNANAALLLAAHTAGQNDL